MKQNSLESVLKTEGFIIYPIRGMSMLPLLVQNEDTVKIEPLNGEAKINDCVLYKGTNNYILHRVIGIEKKNYLIVGDNNNTLERVNKSRVIGVMVGYFKKKRYVSVNDSEYLEYVENNIDDVDYRYREKIYPKIPNEWKYIFSIIGEVIGAKNNHEVYENLNWNEILKICKKHSITAIVGSKIDRDICPKEFQMKFDESLSSNLRKTIMFDAERSRITKLFKENNIDYCFLKGIITNTLYPQMGLREFADNDILIKDKDSKLINTLLTSDKYEAASLRGVHDSYHKDPFYNFEFHRRLFDEKKAYNGFFNNIWSKVIKKENESNEFFLNDEDFYIYNLAHFYKHYSKGGAGIRNFIDMYLIKRRLDELENINEKYIIKSLKEANLDKFEDDVLTLIYKMFVDSEKLSYMDILYVMESGTYGLLQNDVNNQINKKDGSKVKYLLSRIFLPYRNMKVIFPILIYLPFLLPIFWVVRLFKPLFNKESREHLNCELNTIKEYKKNK